MSQPHASTTGPKATSPGEPPPRASSPLDSPRRIIDFLRESGETPFISTYDHAAAVDRFRSLLAASGPVFAQLGRYLGTRPDCLPPEHCLLLRETGALRLPEVAEIAPFFEALYPDVLAPWIRHLSGDASLSDYVIHVYRWSEHPELAFHLVDSEFVEAWTAARLLLSQLEPTLRRLWPAAPSASLLGQFVCEIEQRLNLSETASRLQKWEQMSSRLTASAGMLMPSRVAKGFCRPGLLVIRSSSATGIPFPHHSALPVTVPSAATLRVLCRAWFEQALNYAWLPANPSAAHLIMTVEPAVDYLGEAAPAPPPEFQNAFAAYFTAVAFHRPAAAAEALVSIFHRGPRAIAVSVLADRFRQIVPFRDGGWGRAESSDSFAEQIFVQWRIAAENGYEPPDTIVPFLRSFWELALLVHRLHPLEDVLATAAQEYRRDVALNTLRQIMTPEGLVRYGQEWLSLALEIPERLGPATGDRRFAKTVPASIEERPKSPSLRVMAAHGFVLCAIGALLLAMQTAGAGGVSLLLLGGSAFGVVAVSMLGAARWRREKSDRRPPF